MKATKRYGECGCGCGQIIDKGMEFEVVDGMFYLAGHKDNPASPASPDETGAKKMPRRKPKAKTVTETETETESPKADGQQKAIKKDEKPEDSPKAQPKAKAGKEAKPDGEKPKAEPKPKKEPKERGMNPNRITAIMVAEQKHTDDEIVEAVLKVYPDRPVKRIRLDISTKRSTMNKGGYKTYLEEYKPELPVRRMVKVGNKLFPFDEAPAVQEQPKPKAEKGLLKKVQG